MKLKIFLNLTDNLQATGQRIGTIFQSLSTIGLAMGLSMYYEWKLGLVCLAFTPFILLAVFTQQRLMRGENENYHSALEKSTKVNEKCLILYT